MSTSMDHVSRFSVKLELRLTASIGPGWAYLTWSYENSLAQCIQAIEEQRAVGSTEAVKL